MWCIAKLQKSVPSVAEIQLPDVMHEGQASGFAVVSHSSFGPVTVATNIPFAITETNINNVWSDVTNSFTAPMDGFYLFTASIGSEPGTPCKASVVLTTMTGSRRVVALTTANAGPTGGSNQVILMLSLNDQVSVQLHAAGGLTFSSPDKVFVTFSGLQLNNPGAAGGGPIARRRPCWFQRAIDYRFGPVTQATNIPFPVIEVAEGIEGWNPTTNQFQAPITGAYLFYAASGRRAVKAALPPSSTRRLPDPGVWPP